MQTIANIIFDLGGVFLDLNYQKTQEAFTNLGIANFEQHFTQHHANPLFEQLEKGEISPQQFYNLFRQHTNSSLSNANIQFAWNALLLGFDKEKISWLQLIKNKYRIFLFSNTNQIHYDAFMDIFKRDIGMDVDFNSLFEKAYYSQNMGVRKPYKESFMYIINEQQLQVAETLFIDDTPKNIEAAKAIGLQTVLLLPSMNVMNVGL
jgi:glucose-1-phosphatase